MIIKMRPGGTLVATNFTELGALECQSARMSCSVFRVIRENPPLLFNIVLSWSKEDVQISTKIDGQWGDVKYPQSFFETFFPPRGCKKRDWARIIGHRHWANLLSDDHLEVLSVSEDLSDDDGEFILMVRRKGFRAWLWRFWYNRDVA